MRKVFAFCTLCIEPHRTHGVQRWGLLLQLWRGLCLYLCLWDITVSPTKTDKRNKTQFFCGVESGGPKETCVRWRPGSSQRKGQFVGREVQQTPIANVRIFRCNGGHIFCAGEFKTRSSAIAEGPRDTPCQLKLCEMSHTCSSNCI